MKGIPIIGYGWVAGDAIGSSENTGCEDKASLLKNNKRINIESVQQYLPNASMRLVDKQSIFVAASAMLAFNSVKELPEPKSTAIAHGSYTAAVNSIITFDGIALDKGFNTVNPVEFPNTVANVTASRIGIWYGLKDRVFALSEGITSGIDAVGIAFENLMKNDSESLAYLSSASEEIPAWFPQNNEVQALEGAVSFLLCNYDLAIKKSYNMLAMINGFNSSFININDKPHEAAIEFIADSCKLWGVNLANIPLYLSGCNDYIQKVFEIMSSKVNRSVFSGDKKQDEMSSLEGFTLNAMFDIIEAINAMKKSEVKNSIICAFDKSGFISCILIGSQE